MSTFASSTAQSATPVERSASDATARPKINPPFRADQVGSLLRPKRLLEARDRAGLAREAADALSSRHHADAAAALRDLEDECIREAVQFQEQVGLRVVTDGEFRRASWAYDLTDRIDGLTLKFPAGAFEGAFSDSGARPPLFYAASRLARKPGGIVVDDFAFTRTLTNRTVKVTIPSPTLLYVRGGRHSANPDAYPDIDAYLDDVSRVYREEIAALAAAGCTYVQIDNTDIAYINDPRFQATARALGMDPRDQIDIQARLISNATKERPANMCISMHMCRGNNAGSWMAEGSYDFVAEKLFSEFDVDAYFMEYDDERSGDFAPLRFAPKDKTIVLGLVTTKRPENDSKDVLKRRIEQAARYVPIENLALSPQCGFASVARGNPITPDDQRRKLALIVEVAHEIWPDA
jgi:5-methyltetrahydropteroyltriglutamate--homocysteine methyltransferase